MGNAGMISATATAFIVGALLDLLLGDPRCLPHPIRGMGLLIHTLERLLRALLRQASKSDPLPASFDASPYRACASRPALPLVEGENGNYSPPREGETASEASGGGQFRTFRAKSRLPNITGEKVAGCILACLVLFIVIPVVILSLHWGGMPAAAYWI